MIWSKGPWRRIEHAEFAVLDWVDWFNNRRLHEAIGYILPAEHKAAYHQQSEVAVLT